MLVDVAFKMKCKYKYTVVFFTWNEKAVVCTNLFVFWLHCRIIKQNCSNNIPVFFCQIFGKILLKKYLFFFNKIPKSSLEQCFQLSLFKYIHEIFFPCFQFKKFKKTFFLLSQQWLSLLSFYLLSLNNCN